MAVAGFFTWPGVKAEQYDQLRQLARWDTDVPPGALFHVAAFDDHGAHITDLWETAEDVQRFVNERPMPVVAKIGIAGQPQVEILAAHGISAPGYTRR